MTTAVLQDTAELKRIIAERQRTGADRWDEVWDGVYIVMPLPDDEHQRIVTRLSTILDTAVGLAGLGEVRAGSNISDRPIDWSKNYRCPDVVVFLPETQAENRDTSWYGGPDFAVEVVSENDRSHEKLPFYAKIGTRELLFVIREPWSLELYRLAGKRLRLVGKAVAEKSNRVKSAVLPLSFRLVAGKPRPTIEVTHTDGRKWTV